MRLMDPTPGSAPAVLRYLLPAEELYVTVRQHPAVLLGPVISAVLGLAAAAFLTELAAPGHQALDAAVWIAWGLLFLRMLLKVMGWSADYFVITSERILMITGVLTRSVGAIPFVLVNDLSYRRPLAGRLLGYGELAVRYGAGDQVLQRIQYLPDPGQLYQRIRRALGGPEGAPPADAEPAGDDQET